MSPTAYHYLEKKPTNGAPVVFAFHGTGGDERQFFGLVEEMLPDAGIIAPRGDVSEHGAARFFRRTGEGVYDMHDLARRTATMGRFVQAHKAAHPQAPIYGVGYSNGANILASVVLSHPDLFDRAALLHPLIPWRPDDNPGLQHVDVLITAGRADPICPLPLSQQLIGFFEAQAGTVTAAVHDGGHEIWQEERTALSAFFTAA